MVTKGIAITKLSDFAQLPPDVEMGFIILISVWIVASLIVIIFNKFFGRLGSLTYLVYENSIKSKSSFMRGYGNFLGNLWGKNLETVQKRVRIMWVIVFGSILLSSTGFLIYLLVT